MHGAGAGVGAGEDAQPCGRGQEAKRACGLIGRFLSHPKSNSHDCKLLNL